MNSWQYRYDTGWVACSEWTDQHLGTALGGNVAHNLNAPLADLLVQVFISTDGTDANSFVVASVAAQGAAEGYSRGISVMAVDNNNIKVQTGDNGILVVIDDGTTSTIDTDSYYYKVKVWYLG